jgi:hypothetical protein
MPPCLSASTNYIVKSRAAIQRAEGNPLGTKTTYPWSIGAGRVKMAFMNAQKHRDSIDWLFVLGVGMSLMVAMDLLYAVVNLIIKPT